MTVTLRGVEVEDCCRDISAPSDPTAVIDLLKAVADPTRLKLLYLVAEAGDNDVCGCELADTLGVTAPTITHHMKKLVACDLVNREQRGKWAHYSINPSLFCHFEQLVQALNATRAAKANELTA